MFNNQWYMMLMLGSFRQIVAEMIEEPKPKKGHRNR